MTLHPSSFERTRAVIDDGIRNGLHLGAQLYVSLDGAVRADEAFGEARDTVAMRRDSLTLWMSAGKPITAIAIGKLVDQRRLDWHTPVAHVIPEFARNGKQAVTIHQLLTHTAGLRNADDVDESLAWDAKIAWICDRPLDPAWMPGERAGYHVSATWDVLGEIVRRTAGVPLNNFVREELLRPLGVGDVWLELSDLEIAAYGERIAWVYDTGNDTPVPIGKWNDTPGLARCRPGGNVRGPMRELGRLYEALLEGGRSVLTPETVSAMTSRQRTGLFDETFQFKMDWGLGFIVNSNRDGFQMPYGYGRYASRDTFGHSGNQCSCAFADPPRRLVVAWVFNGLPGERKHQARQRAMNNAIYEDLGLTAEH